MPSTIKRPLRIAAVLLAALLGLYLAWVLILTVGYGKRLPYTERFTVRDAQLTPYTDATFRLDLDWRSSRTPYQVDGIRAVEPAGTTSDIMNVVNSPNGWRAYELRIDPKPQVGDRLVLEIHNYAASRAFEVTLEPMLPGEERFRPSGITPGSVEQER